MLNEQRLLSEFLELVQIDSESLKEGKLAKVLLKKFKDLDLEVYEDDTASVSKCEAGNIIAFMKGNIEGADTVFFNAHMDTVSPGTSIKPIEKDGVVYSDGTTILGADDKVGIAAILEAIHILKENNLPHGDIQFIMTTSEEVGMYGVKALDIKSLKAKFGYSLDTGGKVGNIKVQSPAKKKIIANVYGKSAHAGFYPEKGVSAVMIAAKAVVAMPHGRIDSETTANIGVFKAEVSTNIVCDHVIVKAEARSLDEAKLNMQIEKMKLAFETAAEEMGGRVEIEVQTSYPGIRLNDDDPVVEIVKRAAVKIGRPCELFAAGGGSDANIFNSYGIPTAILSCGFEDVHSKSEKMPIEELNKLAEMVVAIISEIASGTK